MKCKIMFLVVFLFATNIYPKFASCTLSNYVRHYEGINQFTTFKTTSDIKYRCISFRAFNFKFQLILEPQFTFFDNLTPIKITNTHKSYSLPFQDMKKKFQMGHILNVTNSSVTGIIINNSFQGTIRIEDEIYHIEEADRYFTRPVPFQCIIFKQSDIYFNQLKKKFLCNQTVEKPFSIGAQRKKKVKYLNLKGNTICTLKLFADHTFFKFATDHEIIRVILEMILLLEQAQNIFTKTDFDGNGEAESIGFQVNAIQIILSQHSPNYKLFQEDIDIEDYLDFFADYNFDKFCLGMAITHRRFSSGALGVTYTASPNPKKAGGICQRRRRARGQKKPKSYNTVVVTVVGHDGQLMPRFLNGLTIAHELGHAFGSDHDPPVDVECSPHKYGDYLMSRYTLLGNDVHNYQFSPCSRRQIVEVLREKGICLVQRKPVCGNAIVENGEECDCGTKDQCAIIDPCCTPKDGLGTDDECTVRVSQGYKCSPNGKPCCTNRCQYIPAHELKDCTGGNDCFYSATCSGFSSDCPLLVPKPDKEECRNSLGNCIDSVCEDIICSKKGLLQCICKQLNFQCQLCCKARNNICKPATAFGIWLKNNHPYQRPVGEECADGRGFCNFAGQCTKTDKETYVKPPKEMEISDDSSDMIDKTVVDVVEVLIICVLVVAIVSFIVVMIYIFTPFGEVIHKYAHK